MSFSRYLGLQFASYLSFFPLLVLSLRITSPPHISTDATPASVNIEWLEDTGDPSSIGIQILCGTTSVFQQPRITRTSVHGYFINDVNWDGNTFKGTCVIQAFDGATLLATGPSFSAPQFPVTDTPTQETPQSPPPPPKSTSRSISITFITPVVPPTSTRITTTPSPSTEETQTPPTRSSSSRTISLNTTSEIHTTITITTSSAVITNSSTQAKSTAPINLPGPSSPVVTFPTPTASAPVSASKPTSNKKSIAPIIGGTIGGIIFLALILGLLWVYFRHRRSRKNFVRMRDSPSSGENERLRVHSFVSSFFTNEILNITSTPMVPDEDRFGHFHQVQREVLEARRQRDILEFNLSNRGGTVYSIAEDPPGNDDLARIETDSEHELRQQYDRLSALVLNLEAQLREIELPPDYTSSSHG